MADLDHPMGIMLVPAPQDGVGVVWMDDLAASCGGEVIQRDFSVAGRAHPGGYGHGLFCSPSWREHAVFQFLLRAAWVSPCSSSKNSWATISLASRVLTMEMVLTKLLA